MGRVNALSPLTDTHAAVSHNDLANAIRALAMDAVEKAQSGHPGMPMGMADIATVLFSRFLKFDPFNPTWPDRDRFIISNGHGSMLLYALSYLTGYEGMTLEQLQNFRQLGSHTAGHPEKDQRLGIETTTGPLGQGLANAVGIALAERILNAEYGTDLVDHYTYVFVGDGCLMEGISHEALSLAGHLKLAKLIVLFDDNHISIDGSTDLSVSEDHCKRLEAYGWHVQKIDGHDPSTIESALKAARVSLQPSFIACRTTIAYGAPHKGGTAGAHGAPLGKDEIALTRQALNWPYAPFEVPEPILKTWRAIGEKGSEISSAWAQRLSQAPSDRKESFLRRMEGRLPNAWEQSVNALIQRFHEEKPEQATRQLSKRVLEVLAPALPELIGGSADLTESNLTHVNDMRSIAPGNYQGRYIHYGVREHGMAAVMNGLSLHGGFIPYGGTFLTFSDYCRPSIRLAALMKQQAIFVMTHDSIGLGEDGPTHQPIEHLASLRAIPNLYVFRPADPIEVAECWMLAISLKDAPSLLALTRQRVPNLRNDDGKENLSSYGGYVLREASSKRRVTLIATGSEVSIACQAQEQLEREGIPAAVVSMPCWELFDQQDKIYRQSVLDAGSTKIAIEAASPMGWERYVGLDGTAIGMTTFGASAPASILYKHFNITAEHVIETAHAKLQTQGDLN
jgi:transketolase